MEGSYTRMVLILSARGNCRILARHKGLGGGVGFVLPLKARAGVIVGVIKSSPALPLRIG